MANLNILFLFVLTKNEGASFRLITHDRFPEDFIKSCEEPDWELPVEVEGNPCDELKNIDQVVNSQWAFVVLIRINHL